MAFADITTGLAKEAVGGAETIATAIAPELAPAFELVGKQIDQFIDKLGEMAKSIMGFVEKSNPGVIAQYNIAVDNLSASLGKMFAPIVASFIPWIDGLNSAFTKLGERLKPVTDAIAHMSVVLGELFASLGDILIGFVDLFKEEIADFARGLQVLSETLLWHIAALQVITGTSPEEREKSVAVRPSSFAGVEEIGKQLRLAALNQGGGVQDKIEGHLAAIRKQLETALAKLGIGGEKLQQVRDAHTAAFTGAKTALDIVNPVSAAARATRGAVQTVQWVFGG